MSAMNNIYWIGGASGAGKSTMARRLAKSHGLTIYDTDQRMGDHVSRAVAQGNCPYLESFLSMTMDQRWLERSPGEMLDSFHWYRGEGFEFILEDLLKLANAGPVIAEGFRLLPGLVHPRLNRRNQAIWLVPTPAFRRQAFETTGSLWDIAGQTSNPELALAKLLARDALFGERLESQLELADLPVMRVDGRRSETELAADIALHFDL